MKAPFDVVIMDLTIPGEWEEEAAQDPALDLKSQNHRFQRLFQRSDPCQARRIWF